MHKLRDMIHKDFPERQLFCPNILLGALSSLFESETRYARALAFEINDFLEKEAPNAVCVDLIGHSQGGFFSRVFTQLYSGINTRYPHYVKVRRLYSLAGVMGGFYCKQRCGPLEGSSPLLKMFNWFSEPEIVYSRFAGMLFTPAGEWKDISLSKYYATSGSLLCVINKECYSKFDVRTELSQLELMVNFWSPDDQVITPEETEIFNFFKNGTETQIQDIEETLIFTDIGLDALKDNERWKRVMVPGFKHRSFVDDDVEWFYKSCLRRYLANEFVLGEEFESVCR